MQPAKSLKLGILALLLVALTIFPGCGFTAPPINHSPTIIILTADSSSININQSITITCIATDQDGDTLTYIWTKTGGTISGSGSTITWTAPATAGTYTITCTVPDGRGGQDSESVNVEVFELDVVTSSVHNLTKDTYYDTIQAALEDADNNNTIEVADGTYDEVISFPSGKRVILQSINGPSLTIIRGNDDLDTVTFSGSLTGTTMEGFTITHTGGLIGRGIFVYNGNFTINNCVISGNSAEWGSGIGICGNSTLTVIGSTISGNSAVSGGGIYNYTGSTLTIYGSTISDNSVSEWGGGIANFDNSTLTITGSIISGNSAGYNGGGIYIGLNSGTISIGGDSANKKNTICGNYKSGDSLSLNQQIRDDYGSLYDTYRGTNQISTYCSSESNHAPVITSTAITSATVGEAYTYNVEANDPDGDSITYFLVIKPNGMNINSSIGLITWTPSTAGEYDVTIKISDGEFFNYQEFKIIVDLITVEGEYSGFYNFPKEFFESSTLAPEDVVKVTDRIYLLEKELAGGNAPFSFAKGEYNEDVYGTSSLEGFVLGELASPANNNGQHSWDVIAHEIGHSFWNWSNFYHTLATPGPFLHESTAVLTAQYIYERIKQEPNNFNLPQDAIASLDAVYTEEREYQRGRYEEYINLGKPYSQDESGPNYAILTSQALNYKWFLIGDEYGWKKFQRFYKGFSTDLKDDFTFWQDGVSDIEETTYTIAALNVAFNQDFRQEFRDLNFPIDDVLYNEIYSIILEYID